jgi:predicted amidohydrolase
VAEAQMIGDSQRWRVAAVQMTSTDDRHRNLGVAEYLVRRAADSGAKLVALPEHFAAIPVREDYRRDAEPLDGDLARWLRNLATELGCYILGGSFPERIPRRRVVFNTSLLLAPTGETLAAYRKMHLFDIDMPGRAVFKESRTVAAGPSPITVETPLGVLGLSICYDLRFPELYRHLALHGGQVLFVPSAFTAYTGRHHWMALLRARAIENQCWIVAPAQVGRHNARRESHGHSAVIDPWGNVVALLEDEEGVITAEIDLRLLRKIRSDLPCLRHARGELLGLGK